MNMKTIERTPLSKEGTLDRVISKCGQYRLYPKVSIKNYGEVISVGHFAFYASPHSTGCCVMVWIILPDEQPRNILNTSYWYSTNYTFNSHRVEQGVWDDQLKLTIEGMKERINEKEQADKDKQEDESKIKLKDDEREKDEFSDRFMKAIKYKA